MKPKHKRALRLRYYAEATFGVVSLCIAGYAGWLLAAAVLN
jgi:hypothetical protein